MAEVTVILNNYDDCSSSHCHTQSQVTKYTGEAGVYLSPHQCLLITLG